MNTTLILSAICIPGLIWSIVLWRRARDWSMRLLALLLGIMPVYQVLLTAIESGSLNVPGVNQLRNLVDLGVNVVFLFCIFLLEFAINQRNRADLQLRMMESNVTVYREGTLAEALPRPAHHQVHQPERPESAPTA
jgi:transcriptional regulator with XRE-family HTH domain